MKLCIKMEDPLYKLLQKFDLTRLYRLNTSLSFLTNWWCRVPARRHDGLRRNGVYDAMQLRKMTDQGVCRIFDYISLPAFFKDLQKSFKQYSFLASITIF